MDHGHPLFSQACCDGWNNFLPSGLQAFTQPFSTEGEVKLTVSSCNVKFPRHFYFFILLLNSLFPLRTLILQAVCIIN